MEIAWTEMRYAIFDGSGIRCIIRSSERNFYQKVTDIYATSIDYKNDATLTKEFFATVQNKMHYAIHGQTAAEMISQRVEADKPFLGLTSFQGKYITTRDLSIAKNYRTLKIWCQYR